jgi:hypothetical protein
MDQSKKYFTEMYHGNPVGDGRALVTWDFGEDTLQLFSNWIGMDFRITRFNQQISENGIEGEMIDVFYISSLKTIK